MNIIQFIEGWKNSLNMMLLKKNIQIKFKFQVFLKLVKGLFINIFLKMLVFNGIKIYVVKRKKIDIILVLE